ncbi:MAG: hypothetical protein PUC50_17160 [Bacteroidales bacterium]|nr:hypothetical protein [Bacteroidales bacterium]
MYYDSYIEKIKNYYLKLSINNYEELLSAAGKCYQDMQNFNIEEGKWSSYDNFDDCCVFYMAGWILQNRNYTFLKGFTEGKLADAIATSILNYVNNEHKN